MSKVCPDCLLESIHYSKNDAFCLHDTFNKTDQKYFYLYDLSEISFSTTRQYFLINALSIYLRYMKYIYSIIYNVYLFIYLCMFIHVIPSENIKEYILYSFLVPLY